MDRIINGIFYTKNVVQEDEKTPDNQRDRDYRAFYYSNRIAVLAAIRAVDSLQASTSSAATSAVSVSVSELRIR